MKQRLVFSTLTREFLTGHYSQNRREGDQISQRKKLSFSAVSEGLSTHPTGSSVARMTLQNVPSLGEGGRALYNNTLIKDQMQDVPEKKYNLEQCYSLRVVFQQHSQKPEKKKRYFKHEREPAAHQKIYHPLVYLCISFYASLISSIYFITALTTRYLIASSLYFLLVISVQQMLCLYKSLLYNQCLTQSKSLNNILNES